MSIIHPPQTLRCGDTWEFSGPLTDNSGNPLTLAGATLTWKIDSLDQSENFLTVVSGFGITVTNFTTATIQYLATATQTAAIPPGTYYDTMHVLLADGVTGFTVIEGIINASPIPT